jgi:cytochrome c-type biogenesis protein
VVGVSAAALLAAAAAGLASFLSPCVLPVVPGYLAVLGAVERIGGVPRPADRTRVLRTAGLFCAGFAVVFVAFGLTATALGRLLVRHHTLLTRLGGGVVLLMAAYLVGTLLGRWPGLYGELRFHPRSPAAGVLAAPLAGAAFAAGWSPCLGPVLGSILAVAATQGRAVAGAALLGAYCVGLAVPFLAVGLLYDRLAGPLRRLRRAGPAVTVVTAAVLAGVGVLLVLDRVGWLTAQLTA